MEENWKKRLGVVYSTDPEYQYDTGQDPSQETPDPEKQELYVSLDRKNRKGKAVTLVEGFRGSSGDLKTLGRTLRQKCGVGGTEKNGGIFIQGDFRERVSGLLSQMGYSVKKKGG